MGNPNNGGEWGIFGGAFNPVHHGHLTLARELNAAKRSDGILIVPSFNPPFKATGSLESFADRVEMLRLAIGDDACFQISTIEAEFDSPGYTLLTVRALKKRYPNASFYFIIGADLLGEFRSWYEAEEILREVTIVAGSRPGAEIVLPGDLPADRFEIIPTQMVDLASRDVRARIREGISFEELRELVPAPVARYILDHGLYHG
jgi:nicotinate-nucleotide adenylyltransferase